MSAWTYYAPLWLGTLVAGLALALGWNELWQMPGWRAALWLIGASLVAGLVFQIELIGAQGAFAQVLPVPGGKTVRGPGAVFSGVLLLVVVNLALILGVFLYERAWSQAWLVGGISAAALVASLAVYAWSLPAAQQDFADERRV